MVIREHTLADGCVGMDPSNVYSLYDGQQNDVLGDFIAEVVADVVKLSSLYRINHLIDPPLNTSPFPLSPSSPIP